MMKNPCYNCEDRCAGCHVGCERYKTFRITREIEYNYKRKRDVALEYQRSAKAKSRRK